MELYAVYSLYYLSYKNMSIISNCCGARVAYIDSNGCGLCCECKEWCEAEEESDSEFCLGKMD